jgi:hypothetical protein
VAAGKELERRAVLRDVDAVDVANVPAEVRDRAGVRPHVTHGKKGIATLGPRDASGEEASQR